MRSAVRKRLGAVSARLESGTLRIVHSACPNLLREAEFYAMAPNAAPARRKRRSTTITTRWMRFGTSLPRLTFRREAKAGLDRAAKP
jgi:hypothetical protein